MAKVISKGSLETGWTWMLPSRLVQRYVASYIGGQLQLAMRTPTCGQPPGLEHVLFEPIVHILPSLQRVTKKFDLPTPAVEDVKDYGADQKQPYVPPPGYVRSSTKPFGDDSADISYTADAADRVSATLADTALRTCF